jgi:hypothetical protein
LLRDEADHPRAKEEYYKIQLGPLEQLERPIRAETWRRVTFLYTTGEYLLKAGTVNDLVVQSEERKTLWQALRERAGSSYASDPAEEIELDPAILAALLGIREG